MPLEHTKTKRKPTATSQHDEPKPKTCKYEPQSLLRPHKIKRKRACTGEDEAPAKRVHCDQDCVFLLDKPKFNPVDEVWQHSVSAMLGLQFVRKNRVRPGGPNVPLTPPDMRTVKHITGDGNCLFRSFAYIITVSETNTWLFTLLFYSI